MRAALRSGVTAGFLVATACATLMPSPVLAVDYDFENLGPAEEESGKAAAGKVSTREIFEYFQLTEKVTSASKIEQSLFETPGNVILLSADDILKQGYFDINEILYYQAGFYPAQGTERRTIGSRGLNEDWNNTHYLLLIDGVPYNDNTDGSAHTWEATPLNFVKSVEIIRGPGSALYGSNATNGVIALNTFSGKDLGGKIDIRTRFGSLNTLRTDFLTGNTSGSVQYVLGASLYRTDGIDRKHYDDFLNSGRIDENGKGVPEHVRDGRESRALFFKLQGTGSWENLMLQMHHQSFHFHTFDGWDYQIPDENEKMVQERTVVQLGYKSPANASIGKEITLRYQNYHQYYDLRLGPDNSYQGFYEDGIRELLNTNVQDIFSRIQFSLLLPLKMNVLLGTENTLFYYKGDTDHYSNFDPNTVDYDPYPDNNKTRDLAPFLEPINKKPVLRSSGYTQFSSGNALSKYVQLTLGARYDRFSARYWDKVEDRDFDLTLQNISPRAALVLLPTNTLSFKMLAGQAFRDPAIIELFAVNSWVASSNVKELKPERITTAEAIAIHQLAKPFRYQIGAFYTKFENLISYSNQGKNLLTNLYTIETAGGELEFLVQSKRVKLGIGYGFAHRLAEQTLDPSLTKSDSLVEAPAHNAKLTFTLDFSPLLVALRVMYQGEVLRRKEDVENPDYGSYRPASIPAYTELAARLVYNQHESWQAGIEAKNILNSDQYSILPGPHPNDYMREGRTFYGFFRLYL